jgi:hypothetical protein
MAAHVRCTGGLENARCEGEGNGYVEETTALQQRIVAAQDSLAHALAGLDDATLESEPVVGDWSARALVGHLADWVDEILRAAAIALSGGQVELVADGEAFNRAGVAAHAGDTWADARLRLEGAISEALALVSRLEPGQLDTPTAFPWGGSGTLQRLLGGIAGHQNEHVEELVAWRAAR